MPGDSFTTQEKLGSRFYLTLFGVMIAVLIGAGLVFWLIGAAWIRWGALGGIVFIAVVMLAIGYVYDRRQARA